MNNFSANLGERLNWLRWAIALMLLSQMFLSRHLWFGERTFPCLPVIEGLPGLPLGNVFLGLFVLAILFIRKSVWPAFGLGCLLVVFDITRLQPWFYQDLLLLVALGQRKEFNAWRGCAIVLIGTYFWSGLQKVNGSFAQNIFPWLTAPYHLSGFWSVAPVFEVGVALLLIAPRTRIYGLCGLTLMHAMLLFILGPLGRNFNSVIWPWDLLMPVCAFLVFYRIEAKPERRITLGVGVVGVLVGILPALNFFGFWDDNLSFALYSGKTKQGFIFVPSMEDIAAEYQGVVGGGPDQLGFDVSAWAIEDLNVPPYPERRVFEQLQDRLSVPGSKLVITDPLRRVGTDAQR